MATKHSNQFYKSGLNQETLFVLAMESARNLGWKVSNIHSNGFTAYTNFSENSWDESITIDIYGTQVNVTSQSKTKGSEDHQRNIENVNQLTTTLDALEGSFSPEEVAEKYAQFREYIQPEEKTEKPEKKSFKERTQETISLFIPAEGYIITPILLYLNLAIFILMVVAGVNPIEPSIDSLLEWGANSKPNTLDGEWWRLISSCFIHIGVMHLLLNMYALLYIGSLLEPYLGKLRFSLAYLLSGIGASALSLYWHEITVSAGASGAIFGMYGVFLAMLTTNLIEKSARKELLTSIGLFVAYNLLYGLKGGIDNAAHIGGLISGLIIGYVFYPSIVKPEQKKLNKITLSIASVLILGGSFILYSNTKGGDIMIYQEKMDAFAIMEEKALSVYELHASSSDAAILRNLENVGLPNWRGSILMLQKLSDLDISDELKSQNALLIQYCELRIESYELIIKSIEERTDQYDDDLTKINARIESVIASLSE